jgi:pyruvate dehydrogenase E1 component alpha subunit
MPFADAVNVDDIAVRAAGYGFPGEVVDGNDYFAVREAAERAVARARAGEGPTLIEAKSYRITPHSAATPNDNRPHEELELWRSRDPIARFAEALVERRLVARDRVAELEAEAVREVEEATEYALSSPFPEAETALTDVYAPSGWNADGRLR